MGLKYLKDKAQSKQQSFVYGYFLAQIESTSVLSFQLEKRFVFLTQLYSFYRFMQAHAVLRTRGKGAEEGAGEKLLASAKHEQTGIINRQTREK